ncbi:MAG TPA: MOSC domain-containing protein [Stellaceae bacterium]|nr:MOSC domain-containing protein [Stellaceae bacterium]
MEQLGTIETICRYPVKSMAGEDVAAAFAGFGGLMGDRVYAFMREGGTTGFPWLTARDREDLVLYRPRFRAGAAAALPADLEASLALGPGVNPVFPPESAFEVDVATPEGKTLPVRSPELADDLARTCGAAVTLRFSERSLTDCRPLSLIGNASVRALGSELGMTLDRRRFRANLYADWREDLAYRENDLVGRTLAIGERLRIAILERDPRCQMITIDPSTAQTDRRILRHVNEVHGTTLGVYAAVLVEGVVRKGDGIWVV